MLPSLPFQTAAASIQLHWTLLMHEDMIDERVTESGPGMCRAVCALLSLWGM